MDVGVIVPVCVGVMVWVTVGVQVTVVVGETVAVFVGVAVAIGFLAAAIVPISLSPVLLLLTSDLSIRVDEEAVLIVLHNCEGT